MPAFSAANRASASGQSATQQVIYLAGKHINRKRSLPAQHPRNGKSVPAQVVSYAGVRISCVDTAQWREGWRY